MSDQEQVKSSPFRGSASYRIHKDQKVSEYIERKIWKNVEEWNGKRC